MYENRTMDNMGGILRLAEADFFLKTYRYISFLSHYLDRFTFVQNS
jgi:hypothetical protein